MQDNAICSLLINIFVFISIKQGWKDTQELGKL